VQAAITMLASTVNNSSLASSCFVAVVIVGVVAVMVWSLLLRSVALCWGQDAISFLVRRGSDLRLESRNQTRTFRKMSPASCSLCHSRVHCQVSKYISTKLSPN